MKHERFILRPMPVSIREIAKEAMAHYSVCVLCDTQSQARTVMDTWRAEGVPDTFLVTQSDTPEARGKVLYEIRRRQKEDLPARVAATPCIETGVDLDFRHMYRTIASKEHLLQSSMRLDRRGLWPDAAMQVFIPRKAVSMGLVPSEIQTIIRVLEDIGFSMSTPEGIGMLAIQLQARLKN